MNSESIFSRLLRRLGHGLIRLGSPSTEPDSKRDYRWNDPQTDGEAIHFLVARAKTTAAKNGFSTIGLLGPQDDFSKQIADLLGSGFAIRYFSTVSDVAQLPEEERNMMVLVVASPRAKVIHEIASTLVSDERTVDLPLEYAVAPKRENEQIDHMWENSADFVSPLHVQPVDCFALFKESLEKFEPKTGIRDFLDLVQCVNHIVANEVTGDFAEFGSFKGQSGYLLGRYLEESGCKKRLFLFDAFESFPQESIGIDHFWSKTHEVDYDEVHSKFIDLPYVSLVRGDFTQTLPQSECGKLALAFVDCDSFRGTKYLIEEIFEKRLAHGGLMIFEDYGHAGLLGNRLAVHEAFDGKHGTFRFFSQFSGSFVVCKTDTGQL